MVIWDCFVSHILERSKQTDPFVEVLFFVFFLFFVKKELSHNKDNSPKNVSRRKEYFRLDFIDVT